MGAFNEMLEELLSDSDFAESVSALPLDGQESARVSLTARVKREQSPLRTGEKESFREWRATVLCHNYAHATQGGLATVVPGQKFKLPIVKDGTAVDGWIVESAEPHHKGWEIVVVYRERTEAGGKRMVRG